jgi:Fe-S cluster biogenesis protein NfuA/nitrite reductase/ring-hydroxylating ferredoxin subunit
VTKQDEQGFQRRMQRIETLVQHLAGWPDPAARAGAEELMQALLELHGAGLERLLEIVAADGAPGLALIDRLAADDLVGSLLLLHDLHPDDCPARVRQALDRVRPYLGSHGGDVELIGVAGDVVHLRLLGSCHGCPSSAMTLKLAVEDAIYAAAPEVTAIEVEGLVAQPPAPPPGFVPLSQIHPRGNGHTPTPVNGNGHPPTPNQAVAWQPVNEVTALAAGALRTLDVAGRAVSFCRVGETFYAYDNTCPHCGQALDEARLEAAALVCPACGGRYDVRRAGQGLDEPGKHLEPVPLLVEQGQVKIALPVLVK